MFLGSERRRRLLDVRLIGMQEMNAGVRPLTNEQKKDLERALWAIANAFQQQGVKVSVEDIRKANNLDANAVLKVGQKLFIPSP